MTHVCVLSLIAVSVATYQTSVTRNTIISVDAPHSGEIPSDLLFSIQYAIPVEIRLSHPSEYVTQNNAEILSSQMETFLNVLQRYRIAFASSLMCIIEMWEMPAPNTYRHQTAVRTQRGLLTDAVIVYNTQRAPQNDEHEQNEYNGGVITGTKSYCYLLNQNSHVNSNSGLSWMMSKQRALPTTRN